MDKLPEEKAVTLYVNGEKTVTFMTTPEYLRQLIIGYAKNTGMMTELTQIERLYACDDEVEMMLEGKTLQPKRSTEELVLSGCGQATVEIEEDLPKVESDYRVALGELQAGFHRMLKQNRRYRESGGMHAASVVSGSYFCLAEDVGRHNAHDKVTGIALEAGVDLGHAAILSSGRISSDMVLKAVIAGVPVLASISVPTDLAATLAETYGITLIGRMLKAEPIVFTCKPRIQESVQN